MSKKKANALTSLFLNWDIKDEVQQKRIALQQEVRRLKRLEKEAEADIMKAKKILDDEYVE